MSFAYYLNKTDPTTLELKLTGSFDESADLPNDIDFNGISKIYVDFGAVKLINSSGIKRWVNFCSCFETQPDLQIYFRNCTKVVIDQINLIEGFFPEKASVQSLYIPVYCKKCDQDFHVFQEVSDLNEDLDDVSILAAAEKSEQSSACSHEFELDFIKDQFFKFLKPS